MNNDYALNVKNISKKFGALKAVNNISFAVNSGEIFGFLGPNGAGKTTSVRMVTGVIPADSGEIYIAGHDLDREPLAAKIKIGIAPEMANAYTDFTAVENILFMAGMYGLSGSDVKKRAVKLLEKFGLKNKIDKKVKHFSKGMTQRVVLCMSLINEPDILFLDEPTGGLDVQSRRMIQKIIRQLNAEGTTVFLTTHNIEEANQLCERIAIMNHGKIAAIDTPENLKQTFKSSRSVEVTFRPVNAHINFKEIENVEKIEKQGNKFRLYTSQPGYVISETVRLIKKNNLELQSVNTLGPSLEEVFVNVTGGEMHVN